MLILFGRTVILYFTAVLVIRIMGKRQIGQLQPFELVITIIIAELVVIPMQDKDVPLLEGLVPAFTLLFLQYLVSLVLMKSEQLRVKGFPDVSDVEFAVLETNGELSVVPKSQKRPVQPADLQLATSYEGLPLPLIVDGKVKVGSLAKARLDRSWLQTEMQKQGIKKPKDVLYASLGTDGTVFVQARESNQGWQETGTN